MQQYVREFLDFSVETGVLKFGEFTLKSGRLSPYFFNTGLFNSGASLARLGRDYAQTIVNADFEFDVLYGPAYKGIPLASVTAAALYDHHGIDVGYAFNRKEAKDHGEGGIIVGHPLNGRVLVIDDVISAGTSARESVDIIHAQGAEVAGMVIALDRQERGQGSLSAIQEVEQDYQVPVAAIARLDDLVSYLRDHLDSPVHLQAINAYREEYGT